MACCSLKTVSRVEQVRLALAAPLVLAADLEPAVRCSRRRAGRRARAAAATSVGDHVEADAAEARCRAGEELVDELLRQADRLEDLRAGVGRDGGHAHLGHHLQHALAERLDVVAHGLVRAVVALGRRQVGHVATGHAHRPRVLALEPGNDAQERGLAAAGRAEEADELAGADGERNLAEGHELLNSGDGLEDHRPRELRGSRFMPERSGRHHARARPRRSDPPCGGRSRRPARSSSRCVGAIVAMSRSVRSVATMKGGMPSLARHARAGDARSASKRPRPVGGPALLWRRRAVAGGRRGRAPGGAPARGGRGSRRRAGRSAFITARPASVSSTTGRSPPVKSPSPR